MTQPSASCVRFERRGAISEITNRWKNVLANSELTDVEFAVGRQCGGVQKIRAHRLTLGVSSEVFHAMFYGSLAERNDAVIDVPDIPPDAFKNMLSYVYTGTVENLKEDNVLQTLYCSDKYDLPWLAELCMDFVLQDLKPENCLMYLGNAQRWTPDFDVVMEKCCDVLDVSSKVVLQSEYVTALERKTLEMILERDTLSAEENIVYTAVEKWAATACARKKLAPTPANRRRLLGGALYHVRFPLMNDEELANGPVKSGLLTANEVRELYLCKHGTSEDQLKFSTKPRKYVAFRLGSKREPLCRNRERLFVLFANGYWYPAIVTGDNEVDDYAKYKLEEPTDKGDFVQPAQVVHAGDILKRGLVVYAYIDGGYQEATYGVQRAGRHTVEVAGRESSVAFRELKIAGKHVEEWKAA
ncbi:BTB/POZ domain-containing protein 3-like [Paramacrobiotus metropolitanus]|uniref:BTB/POZ domain-containing protein 3-like n=1 Tax=Paramacrobiotus metropolitanus TaxID=2943436 RepID=UPI002445E62E|nr:BTB/POZ domain-containing protein 3-like [Paramacrobiotus metropolitanus]